jgi:hypothetical protein
MSTDHPMSPVSLVFLLLLLPRTAAVQDGLDARNEAFLRAVRGGDRDSIAAFFPGRGEWTWTQTRLEAPPWQRTRTQRFRAAETLRTISPGGVLCYSFLQPTGGSGPFEERLGMRALANGTRWRRVAGDRFVPPGEPARSPVFVQWRREDGRWVVASFGDVDVWFPRVIGRIARDTVVRGPPGYATGESWYVNNDAIGFEGEQYVKYGLPRPVADSLLVRVGHRGAVPIYAAKDDAESPAHLYVPIAPGQFQPYEAGEGHGSVCS